MQDYKNTIPDYAKDLKLNLAVLQQTPGSDLTQSQIAAIALAVAYATKSAPLINAIKNFAAELLSDAETKAAKAAAAIMGMNNIYYRFIHLVSNKAFQKLPAGLRMNIIGNPGIEKSDFELMSLAVSAINGCGLCIDSHVKVIEKSNVSQAAIQHAIKIAAVLNGLAQVDSIEDV